LELCIRCRGSITSDGCNSSIVPDIGFEEERTPTVSREKFMLWHQRLEHIGEKGLRLLHGKGMVKVMCLDLCRFHHWENLCTVSHL
jgi:hypothetical protein